MCKKWQQQQAQVEWFVRSPFPPFRPGWPPGEFYQFRDMRPGPTQTSAQLASDLAARAACVPGNTKSSRARSGDPSSVLGPAAAAAADSDPPMMAVVPRPRSRSGGARVAVTVAAARRSPRRALGRRRAAAAPGRIASEQDKDIDLQQQPQSRCTDHDASGAEPGCSFLLPNDTDHTS
jgi:hypothetical protein